jgi:hypothetical protein
MSNLTRLINKIFGFLVYKYLCSILHIGIFIADEASRTEPVLSIKLQVWSRKTVDTTVIHLLVLLILCTKGDGFTLFDALNSDG